jgi:hypothetical protein
MTLAIITGAAAAGAFLGKEVVKTGAKLAEIGLTPVVKEWGDGVAAEMRQRREEALNAAGDMLEEAGVQPTAVPHRVLVPALQAASLEDDQELRRRWATLIANAADPSKLRDVTPSFVAILSELSPVEAKILETVYFMQRASMDFVVRGRGLLRLTSESDGSVVELPVPYGDFKVLSDNLHRLGLVDFKFGGPTTARLSVHTKLYQGLPLSPLGRHFMAACTRPPKDRSPELVTNDS